MGYHTILCRYNEIATKGNNRVWFEKCLKENLHHFCNQVCPCRIQSVQGRIYIRKGSSITEKNPQDFTQEESEELTKRLVRCFGLTSFSFCMSEEPTLDGIKRMICASAPDLFRKILQENPGKPVQFRSRARRSDKSFYLNSHEIEIEIATLIESLMGKGNVKVNLTDPQISIGVELREKNSMIYYDSVR